MIVAAVPVGLIVGVTVTVVDLGVAGTCTSGGAFFRLFDGTEELLARLVVVEGDDDGSEALTVGAVTGTGTGTEGATVIGREGVVLVVALVTFFAFGLTKTRVSSLVVVMVVATITGGGSALGVGDGGW